MRGAMNAEWDNDCLKWRGRVLRGHYAHYCYDWDGLPVDETCTFNDPEHGEVGEWPCVCFSDRWSRVRFRVRTFIRGLLEKARSLV